MEPRGIYRERNGWGTQHSVRVKYDEHQELDVAEDRYRARGYQPPFDKLPWEDDDANDFGARHEGEFLGKHIACLEIWHDEHVGAPSDERGDALDACGLDVDCIVQKSLPPIPTSSCAAVLIASPFAKAGDEGIVKVKSAFPMGETIARLKTDIPAKA